MLQELYFAPPTAAKSQQHFLFCSWVLIIRELVPQSQASHLSHTSSVQEHFPVFFCPSFLKLWDKTQVSLIFYYMTLLEKSRNTQKCFTSLSRAINVLCLSEGDFTRVWLYWWRTSSTTQTVSPFWVPELYP